MNYKLSDKYILTGVWSVFALFYIAGLFTLNVDLTGDHAWRQSITMIVSQNLYELGMNPWYPRYDICGGKSPEIFATEFPLLNLIIAQIFNVSGISVFWARFVVWTTSFIGIAYFYKLVEIITNDKRAAAIGMIMLMGSIYLMFARKVMPDTFSLSIGIVAVYYYVKYYQYGKLQDFLIATISLTLSLLSKMPSLVMMSFLVIPVLRQFRLKQFIVISVGTLISLSIMSYWYFIWGPYLQSITTCMPLIYPVSLSEGLTIFINNIDKVLFRFYDNAFRWWGPYLIFILSTIYLIYKKQWHEILMLVSVFIIMLLFIAKTGNVFHSHNYYVIPAVPTMSFIIAIVMSKIVKNNVVLAGILVGLLTIPTIKNIEDYRINRHLGYERLESILKEIGVPDDALIMVNGGNMSPILMYYSKRKGWAVNEDVPYFYSWMIDYKREGLQYMIMDKKKATPDISELNYPKVYEDDLFVIYKP